MAVQPPRNPVLIIGQRNPVRGGENLRNGIGNRHPCSAHLQHIQVVGVIAKGSHFLRADAAGTGQGVDRGGLSCPFRQKRIPFLSAVALKPAVLVFSDPSRRALVREAGHDFVRPDPQGLREIAVNGLVQLFGLGNMQAVPVNVLSVCDSDFRCRPCAEQSPDNRVRLFFREFAGKNAFIPGMNQGSVRSNLIIRMQLKDVPLRSDPVSGCRNGKQNPFRPALFNDPERFLRNTAVLPQQGMIQIRQYHFDCHVSGSHSQKDWFGVPLCFSGGNSKIW